MKSKSSNSKPGPTVQVTSEYSPPEHHPAAQRNLGLARKPFDLPPCALGRQVQIAHDPFSRQGPGLEPRKRHLVHEAIGRAIEELFVLYEEAFQVGAESAGDAQSGFNS
jgi:hypothetical protein